MGKREQTKLINAYKKYRISKRKKNVLEVFRDNMAEIIFRTTKLEGEPVTKRMVLSIFS